MYPEERLRLPRSENIGRETEGLMTIDGMDEMQIREFALFLYEKSQKKSEQLDEMIAWLNEIGKDLKEVRKQIVSISPKPSGKPKRSVSIISASLILLGLFYDIFHPF